jgi:hypothetical protein
MPNIFDRDRIPPSGQGLRGPGGFAEHLSGMVSDIQERETYNPFGGAAPTAENIEQYMGPMQMGVGAVKNITGVPQGILGVGKYAQTTPTPANPPRLGNKWQGNVFRSGNPHHLSQELMRIKPEKMRNIKTRLNRFDIDLKPTFEPKISGSFRKGQPYKEVNEPVLQLYITNPQRVPEEMRVLATIERLPDGGYWINDAGGRGLLRGFVSTDIMKKQWQGRRGVDLQADTLEELLEKLAKNIM